MKAQFDSIVEEHHQLQDYYGRAVTVQEHHLFSDINKWEQESIFKIKQVATEARNELQKILVETIKRTNGWLNELNDRLHTADQNQDYTEKDLTHWEKQLTNINKDFNRPFGIDVVIDTDCSPIYMIKLEKMKEDISVRPSMASSKLNYSAVGIKILNKDEFQMEFQCDSLKIHPSVNKHEENTYGNRFDQTENAHVVLLEKSPSNGSELSEGLLKLAIDHVLVTQKIENCSKQMEEFVQSTLIMDMLGSTLEELDKCLTDICQQADIRSVYIRGIPPDTDTVRHDFFFKYPMIKAMFENEKSLLTQWALDTANEYKRIGDRYVARGDKDLAHQYFTKGVTLYKRLAAYLEKKNA